MKYHIELEIDEEWDNEHRIRDTIDDIEQWEGTSVVSWKEIPPPPRETCLFCPEYSIYQLYVDDRIGPTAIYACEEHKKESTGIQWVRM